MLKITLLIHCLATGVNYKRIAAFNLLESLGNSCYCPKSTIFCLKELLLVLLIFEATCEGVCSLIDWDSSSCNKNLDLNFEML